ncbi:MAG: thioredoxin family protein [Hyphomicrobiaceae bacterium]|nr:thioredoxin family protein [Hyphomicrobiaceae bacterium]
MTKRARHKVLLLVSEWCAPCRAAEAVWQKVAERREITFQVLDMAQPEARAVAQQHALRSVPAVVIDDKLMAVGVQTLNQALALVADAPERTVSAMRFVGITLAPSSRWALIASTLYLTVGGMPLVIEGTLHGESLSLPFLHLIGVGFVLFMIFGLSEHMLPRFTGQPIRMGILASTQQVFAHAGTVLLALGIGGAGRSASALGGALLVCALVAFAARILPLLRPRVAHR